MIITEQPTLMAYSSSSLFFRHQPQVHTISFIEKLLNTYIRTGDGKKQFYGGVKFYPPPMGGYDPWPTDPEQRDKVIMIYEFCTKHDIPIMTHCDDQGGSEEYQRRKPGNTLLHPPINRYLLATLCSESTLPLWLAV